MIKEEEPTKPAVRGIMVVFRGEISISETPCLEGNFQMVVLLKPRAGQLHGVITLLEMSSETKCPGNVLKPFLEP